MSTKRRELLRAVAEAPGSIFRLSPRAWVYAAFYLTACALLCVAATAFVVAADGRVGEALLSWVFPESWHFALEGMVEVFLHSASQELLVNLALAASLILVTITLFPLKEHLSHAFEEDGGLTEEDVDPVPLHLEAWEELKLVLLYATFFMSVFWVGYSPEPWRQSAAWVLSTTFLALTFAIDFVSPTLFRHGMRYATVFKALARYPLVSLSFGLLFAAPPILAGVFMNRVAPESWIWILIGLFVAEVLAIVWACVGGTWLAAKMWPEVKDMRPPFWPLRILYWAIVGTLLVWNVKAFSAVGKSLYHKVPLFKSHYSLVPGSMEVDGLGLMDVLSTEPSVGFAVDVQVENPTPTDFVLEENRLEVRHEGELVATTSLAPFVVPAGSTRVQQLGVDLELNLEALSQGLGLLSTKDWELTLFVEVADGMEFPVYIH